MASAPTHPTLAVDLKLLEFARLQFLHMVPNTTGWCGALEAFLSSLAFKLQTRVSASFSIAPTSLTSQQDSLRRRFTNSLRWYYELRNAAEVHIQDLLQDARVLLRGPTLNPLSRPASSLPPSSPPPPSSSSGGPSPGSSRPCSPTVPATPDSIPSQQSDQPYSPQTSTRASEYLRRRCRLCYGGEVAHHPELP